MSASNQIQCLLLFFYSVGERNILQTVLLSFFFSVFIFSMLYKVKIIVIEFIFLGINTFLVLLSRLTAWAKMSLKRAQNTFMPKKINSIVVLVSNRNSLSFALNGLLSQLGKSMERRIDHTINKLFTA